MRGGCKQCGFSQIQAAEENQAIPVHSVFRTKKIWASNEVGLRNKPFMRVTITMPLLLGFLWNLIAVCLMGGSLSDAISPQSLAPGAIAGVVAGYFTIWSRKCHDGKERFFDGITTYYLAIIAYWACHVLFEGIAQAGTGHDIRQLAIQDALGLLILFLYEGTVVFGVLLITLCFISRHLLWKIYIRTTAR